MSNLWIASYVGLWIIVAALVFVMMGLLRQLGLIQVRLGVDPGVLITEEGLKRGTEAPDFEAVDVQIQQPVKLSELRGRSVVLVFLTPNCLACRQLAPHLNEVARAYRDKAEVLAVCYGAGSTCEELARRLRLRTPVLADPDNKIAANYGVNATPFAFLVDSHGTILIRGIVNSWPQLESLLNQEGTNFEGPLPWQNTADRADTIAGVNSGSGKE